MRIAEERPDLLIVEDRPWGFRVIALLFLAGLSGVLFAEWGEMNWFVRAVIGAFIVLLASILLFVAITVTARFDRAAGRIEIVRRGVFGAVEEVYGFKHFARARVEESEGSDSTTYRLVFVFAEAMLAELDAETRARRERARKMGSNRLPLTEVPFTSYLTGARKPPEEMAARVNAWAGVR